MERIAAQEKVIEVMTHEMEAIAERRQVTASKDETSVRSLPLLCANPTDVLSKDMDRIQVIPGGELCVMMQRDICCSCLQSSRTIL